MNRGILATCYARPAGAAPPPPSCSTRYRDVYAGEPFVVVTDGSPSTKATLGSNTAHVTVRADARTGWVVAIAAIDNLVKGASGQAVQCANLLLGLPETTGLPIAGVLPRSACPVTADDAERGMSVTAARGSWPPASPAGIKAVGRPRPVASWPPPTARPVRRGRRVHPAT